MTEPERPVLEIGQHFADYRIEELAGRQSGVGRVYVATHLESERHLEFPPWPVALKVFNPPDGQEAEFCARFEPAAKAQAALHHPNVVSVYEYGTEPLPFMSMTLFRGSNLAGLIASGELDEPMLLPIIESVAAALDGGIEHDLCYRRLHPGGVLVATDSQRAFLADFGVGRAASLEDLLENETLGPFVDYASPEEVRGGEVTGLSNVYSLAAIVFECLTGEPPFPHQAGEQALQARLEREPRKLRRLRPDLPHGLESVLARALDTNPRRRPASPGVLATAIKRAYPKRRRRAPRLRTTTTLARPPALPAAVPAAEASTVVPAREPEVAAAAEPTVDAGPVRKDDTPTPAAEGRPRRERHRSRPLSAAFLLPAALLVAGAAVLGALVAPGPKAKPAAKAAEQLSAGPASLRFPASWSRLPAAPSIPGVALTAGSGLAPGKGAQPVNPRRSLVVGQATFRTLPDAGAPQPVDLGAVQAYRYRGVKRAGLAGLANLYVVPRSSGGSVVLACIGPASSDPFMGRCERVASTLRLTGTSTAAALAPSPTYAAGLRRILGRLDRTRSSARRRLARAHTRNGQGGNAARLSIAYRVARRSGSHLTAPPGVREVHTRLVASLGRAGRAYRDMARAAQTHANGHWSAARREALAAEHSLRQALSELEALGYQPQAGA